MPKESRTSQEQISPTEFSKMTIPTAIIMLFIIKNKSLTFKEIVDGVLAGGIVLYKKENNVSTTFKEKLKKLKENGKIQRNTCGRWELTKSAIQKEDVF